MVRAFLKQRVFLTAFALTLVAVRLRQLRCLFSLTLLMVNLTIALLQLL